MSASLDSRPPSPRRGAQWHEPLKVWYLPAQRPTRRPSADYVWCPDLPGWIHLPIAEQP